MSRGKIGDHLALDHFVGNFVETPVRSIFARLMKHDRTRDEFGIVGQVTFQNRDTTLPDDNVRQVRPPGPDPVTPPPVIFNPRVQPDRVCCYQPESAEIPTNLYHIEYKPAHKIVPDAFRLGLHDMNIIDNVVNCETIPATGSVERAIYDADSGSLHPDFRLHDPGWPQPRPTGNRRDAHQPIWVIGPKLSLASRAISHSNGDYSKQFSRTRNNNTFKPSIVEPHSPLYSSESLRGATGENSSDCLSWLKAESAPQIYFAEKPGA